MPSTTNPNPPPKAKPDRHPRKVNAIKNAAAITVTTAAALLLALAALIGLTALIHPRLDQLEAGIQRLQEQADAHHQEKLAEFRRLTDALNTHHHPPDGEATFTAPPRPNTQPVPSNPDATIAPPPISANPADPPNP